MKASIYIQGVESNRELAEHLEFIARTLRDVDLGDGICVNSAGRFNEGSLNQTDRFRMNLPPLRWVEITVKP